MDNSDHRIALVTGGSRGIGSSIVEDLSASGYLVYFTYHSDDAAARGVVSQANATDGAAPIPLRADVTNEADMSSVFDRIANERGHLDLLVSNAVKEVSLPLPDQTLDDWKIVLDTKLVGIFIATKLALPLFSAAPSPSLVAISTFEAQQPSPDYPAYGVANAGIDAFVKAMAVYLPRYGARVNAICPGPVNTPLWGDDQGNEDLWKEMAEANPVGRNATPADVALAVRWLAEEPTRMINGSFIYVNGGNHLRQP